MSHQPPVPAGNQSPYPLHEAPHAHPAEPPAGAAVARTPEQSRESHGPAFSAGLLGALAAAGIAALAAAGAWAYASQPKAKRKGGKGKAKH